MNTLTCCRKCGPQAALQLQTVNDDREKLALQTELETAKAELERTKTKLESMTKAAKQAQASKWVVTLSFFGGGGVGQRGAGADS